MNLPLKKPQGGSGKAGAVAFGEPHKAAPANFTVGSIQFRNTQLPAELADEVMEQMADSIVELTHELEEANARVAVLEEEQKILAHREIVSRHMAKAAVIEGADNPSLASPDGEQAGRERPEPSPHFKQPPQEALADWRDCAKRLAAAVEHYHPDLRDETEGGWSEERAAIALFDDLECQHQVKRDDACRESCRDKAAADGGWASI